MPAGYCPSCGSKLFPVDDESMQLVGVCSSCTTYNPKYRTQYNEARRSLHDSPPSQARRGQKGR